MSGGRISLSDTGGVRLITFDRPEVKNAFDFALYRAVTEALAEARSDPAVRAVVLTGRGSAFTAGQDLKEMAAIAAGNAPSGIQSGFQGLLDQLMAFEKPLLAAVNGPAIGLGLTLLAHVDLVLVDTTARFRAPFAELGVPPEAASSYLLPRLLGRQRAAEVLLASQWLSAEDAVTAGLALRVCPEGTVLSETMALAERIASFPPGAVALIKALVREAEGDRITAARRREEQAFAALFADPDANPGDDLLRGLHG